MEVNAGKLNKRIEFIQIEKELDGDGYEIVKETVVRRLHHPHRRELQGR